MELSVSKSGPPKKSVTSKKTFVCPVPEDYPERPPQPNWSTKPFLSIAPSPVIPRPTSPKAINASCNTRGHGPEQIGKPHPRPDTPRSSSTISRSRSTRIAPLTNTCIRLLSGDTSCSPLTLPPRPGTNAVPRFLAFRQSSAYVDDDRGFDGEQTSTAIRRAFCVEQYAEGKGFHHWNLECVAKRINLAVAALPLAQRSWMILSPLSDTINQQTHKTKSFQYFLHLTEVLEVKPTVPLQVPISIRSKIGVYENSAWRKYTAIRAERTPAKRLESVSTWVQSIQSPLNRGQIVSAFLEIILDAEGPLQALEYFKTICFSGVRVGLHHVEHEDIANLLATFTQSFRTRLFDANMPGEEMFTAAGMVCGILNNSQLNWTAAQAVRSSFYDRTIRKLQGKNIILCLWLFLQSWDLENTFDTYAQHLYDKLVQYLVEMVPECPRHEEWLLTSVSVIEFLLAAIKPHGLCGYFPVLHRLMVYCCGLDNWTEVWQRYNVSEMLMKQVELLDERQNGERCC